mmetsp:Transcript_2636/g.6602  ORF Transcript_2636/g.6602 Transcript_2636/m.6602 type:complete len:341 (-) Transcript_2636:722-1744(-)
MFSSVSLSALRVRLHNVDGPLSSAREPRPCARRAPAAISRVTRAECHQSDDQEGVAHFQLARRGLLTAAGLLLAGGLPQPILPLRSPAQHGHLLEYPRGGHAAWGATVLGKPVTDPRLLLRDALPVAIPADLLDLDDALRAIGGVAASKRSAAGSRSIAQSDSLAEASRQSEVDGKALLASLRKASTAVRKEAILASVPEANRSAARSLLEDLSSRLSEWQADAGRTAAKPADVVHLRNDVLNISGQVQSLLVTDVPVPEEFAALPQLRGRAVAELKVKDTDKPGTSHRLTMVLDGVNAPITAGNFVDLARRGFYNNMPIQVATHTRQPRCACGVALAFS